MRPAPLSHRSSIPLQTSGLTSMPEQDDINDAWQKEHDIQKQSTTQTRSSSPVDSAVDAPRARKRRRVAKASADKKYQCRHEGCGKSYSRAEHLYRHQLNRKPPSLFSGPQSYMFQQTSRKTSTDVTIPIATGSSCGRICASDIGSVIPLMALSFIKRM